MTVCIVGWYGTETIGDRAILAGILAFLPEVTSNVHVQLGSLYPFFSQRTVLEDSELWNELTSSNISLSIFDSSSPGMLKSAIRESDLLLFGGGPLMDLREMHMVAFAFRYARSKKIPTAIFGCGVGPLHQRSFRAAAADILAHADAAVFRDTFSAEAAANLRSQLDNKPVVGIDPAAYCVTKYRGQVQPPAERRQLVLNLRRMPGRYGAPINDSDFEVFAQRMVEKVLTEYDDLSVLLLPNHYFCFGGDDRSLMNTLKFRINCPRLRVQNRPLSLRYTMETIMGSTCCMGMRYHSILFMALLNGRCRVLNYTETGRGKISGFLNDLDPDGYFGQDRQLSLAKGQYDVSIANNLLETERYSAPKEQMNARFEVFRDLLRQLL